MDKNMHGFADRVKYLREQAGLTQTQLARKLCLSRASVNTWEMGLSAPSTPFIVELSKLFHVTSDYLLGLDSLTIKTDNLTEKEISAILNVIDCFSSLKNENSQKN